MTDLPNEGWLERVIVAALRETLRAHGPIEPTNFSSVAKRVACQVRAAAKESEQEELSTGRFSVTTEGPSRLGLDRACQLFANDLWVPDHCTEEQAIGFLLDQFKRTIAAELEMLDIRHEHDMV